MMSNQSSQQSSDDRPPFQVVREMLDGVITTQCIYIAAKLGIADLLKDGPKSVDELAQSTDSRADALKRVLRVLATKGIFAQGADERYKLTPVAGVLRSDATPSIRATAIMLGEKWYWDSFGGLLNNVKTGDTAFDQVYGMSLFEYLGKNTEAGSIFNNAMTGASTQSLAPIIDAYDFTGVSKIVDVGGGQGFLIANVLKAYPHMNGVLFDQDSVVKEAGGVIESAGVTDRCEIIGGSFFESVPSGADLYTLKMIIHDWNDEYSVAILRNCRKAIAENGRILVLEKGVISPGNDPQLVKVLDLHMMMLNGGRERTEAEYKMLFDASGFQMTRVIPTSSPLDIIIEGKPV